MSALTATATTADLSLADLEAFDPQHKRRDGETDCCCPLCGPGKPVDAAHGCLSYNAQTGAWNCHRCHAKGKLREFWTETAKDARPTSRRARDRQRIRRALQLPPPVQPVDNVDSAAWKKRIGTLARLHGTPGAAYLEGRGLPADFCHAAGVRFASDFFGRPAVVFPLRGENGKLTAAQGRYVDGRNDPRLPRMRTAGARRLGVFATPGAWESAALVLVEAPIDALSLALCGVPAVALCGCEGLPDWLRMRCAFQTVIAAFDADEAGDKAARELARVLEGVGCRKKVLRLRPASAKDWNACLLQQGADTLRAWLASEMASVAATAPAEAETSEEPTEPTAGQHGQSRAVSGGIADPFAADGDDPPHVVFVRALYAEAQAGRLPVQTVTLPHGRTVADPNAAALDLARLCRLAAAVGRTEEAEGHAADLLALVDWWNEQRTVYHDPARDGLTFAEAEARFATRDKAGEKASVLDTP